MNKGWTDEFRRGMEYAANLYEQVDPASDLERVDGSPGAGAMGAVIEFRDLIRKEANPLHEDVMRVVDGLNTWAARGLAKKE